MLRSPSRKADTARAVGAAPSAGPAHARRLDGFTLGDRVYLEPLGLTTGRAAEEAAGRALALAGGPTEFTHARLWRRGNGEVAVTATTVSPVSWPR